MRFGLRYMKLLEELILYSMGEISTIFLYWMSWRKLLRYMLPEEMERTVVVVETFSPKTPE